MNKIIIGLLTYNRVDLLSKALSSLSCISIPKNSLVEVVVCDNYKDGHAQDVIDSSDLPFNITYVYEKNHGIPFARNHIVNFCLDKKSDYLVFFDDDEEVDSQWLVNLFETTVEYDSDVTVGRVVRTYDGLISKEIMMTGYFDDKRKQTGSKLRYAATSNILYKMKVFREWKLQFDIKFPFTGGTDNFLAADIIRKNGKIIYCDNSIVRESVAVHRASFKWIYLRRFRCGSNDIEYFRRLHVSQLKLLLVILKYSFISFKRLIEHLLKFVLTLKKYHAYNLCFEFALLCGYIAGIFNFSYQEYRNPI